MFFVLNTRNRWFEFIPLHHPVPQFSDVSENRSKFARVRAISYQRMDPESGSCSAKWGEYGKTYPPSIFTRSLEIRSKFAFIDRAKAMGDAG